MNAKQLTAHRTLDLAGAPVRPMRPRRLSEHLARAMARRVAYRHLEDSLLVGIALPPRPQLEAALDRIEDQTWLDFFDLAGACIETVDRLLRHSKEREAA